MLWPHCSCYFLFSYRFQSCRPICGSRPARLPVRTPRSGFSLRIFFSARRGVRLVISFGSARFASTLLPHFRLLCPSVEAESCPPPRPTCVRLFPAKLLSFRLARIGYAFAAVWIEKPPTSLCFVRKLAHSFPSLTFFLFAFPR